MNTTEYNRTCYSCRISFRQCLLFIGALLIILAPKAASAQDTTVTITKSMFDSLQIIYLSELEGWKYKPGDDTTWADPDFDDSEWRNLSPADFDISAMPDSLWQGYGWWRLTFEADSSFYKQSWQLVFFTWGAADVYIDGKRVDTFGEFSTKAEEQQINKFSYRTVYPPISLNNQDQHVIAVRYSFHDANKYDKIGNLGMLTSIENFSLGFVAPEFIASLQKTYASGLVRASISLGIMVILLLFHLLLSYQFPKDRSNFLISLVIGVFILNAIGGYGSYLFVVSLPIVISISYLFLLTFYLIPLLLPYTISVMFELDSPYWLRYLPWLSIPLVIPIYFSATYFSISIVILLFMLVAGCSILFKQAIQKKAVGVWPIFIGIFGAIFFMILSLLHTYGMFTIPDFAFQVSTVLIYISFPIGLTLFTGIRYSHLFQNTEAEVKKRTAKLEKSLSDLQAAQNQLVQQEKLASLGQLTAGIAHEIKNPLNFVNNFSDVSIEMLEEAREEIGVLKKSPLEGGAGVPSAVGTEAGDVHGTILELLDDIEANLRKIHEHGSRADGIVKSMLQHSRGGSGEMEPTDLNELVEEYVNLAFHGMRAGKNPINVDIDLQLDEEVGEVPLITEDFSRVIVNLCNNAFDAMAEKLNPKDLTGFENLSGLEAYQPKLTVRTIRENETVTVAIEDNGPGVSDELKEQILQPFFTTKKGTEGTGLGLSITNDIVKAHGGTIEVSSKAGKGAKFNIYLP